MKVHRVVRAQGEVIGKDGDQQHGQEDEQARHELAVPEGKPER